MTGSVKNTKKITHGSDEEPEGDTNKPLIDDSKGKVRNTVVSTRTDSLKSILSFKDSELISDDKSLKEELRSIEWSKEESKDISEVILKRERKKTEPK